MMKRHIAIPLLCVVLVAALSIPVYADSFPYPENNISGYFDIYLNYDDVGTNNSVWTGTEQFGSLWSGIVSGTSEFLGPIVRGSFDITLVNAGSLYIALPYGYNEGFYTSPINQYRDSSNDYVVDFGSVSVTRYTPNGSTFSISSTSASLNVVFLAFRDVPPGNYLYDYIYSISNTALCFGVYGTQSGVYNGIINGVVDGSISYTDGIDMIMNHYDESIRGVTNFQQLTLYSLELGTALERLTMTLSAVAADNVAGLESELDSIVDNYVNDTITLKDAMDSAVSGYSSALSSAQTVEEATGLTATYQATLKELELRSQFKLMEGFDAVITDEEIQKADDYYTAEDELVNAFDVADFDAQLQFDLWWLQMPRNETIEYKKFFDYLMNESDIKYFITIPLAMSLVAIIMGTRMRTRPDRVIERSTTVDSGGSRTTTVKYKND